MVAGIVGIYCSIDITKVNCLIWCQGKDQQESTLLCHWQRDVSVPPQGKDNVSVFRHPGKLWPIAQPTRSRPSYSLLPPKLAQMTEALSTLPVSYQVQGQPHLMHTNVLLVPSACAGFSSGSYWILGHSLSSRLLEQNLVVLPESVPLSATNGTGWG